VKVEVKLFAILKQLTGQDALEVELSDGATIDDLRAAMAEARPELRPILPSVLFAIDSAYASGDTAVRPGAEIACIPPVSGG
jgi:molybdopterin converting factor subunit 1